MSEKKKENPSCTKLKKIAVALIVVGVLCFVCAAIWPPMWVVDNSILMGMGIIFGYASLLYAWEATDRGVDAKIEHGNTKIELTNPDNN